MNTRTFSTELEGVRVDGGAVAAFDTALALFTAAGFDFEVVTECSGSSRTDACSCCAPSDARAA